MAGLRIFAAFIQRVCMQVPEVDPGLLYCPINQLPVSGVRKVGDLVLVAAAFLHHVALQGTDDENLLPLAALKMGIAWKVVPDTELRAEAQRVGERIATLPKGAVSDLKQLLNRASAMDIDGAMAMETEFTVRQFLDPETQARARKFAEG